MTVKIRPHFSLTAVAVVFCRWLAVFKVFWCLIFILYMYCYFEWYMEWLTEIFLLFSHRNNFFQFHVPMPVHSVFSPVGFLSGCSTFYYFFCKCKYAFLPGDNIKCIKHSLYQNSWWSWNFFFFHIIVVFIQECLAQVKKPSVQNFLLYSKLFYFELVTLQYHL